VASVSLHTSATTTTAQQGGTVTITSRYDNTGPDTATNALLSIITSTMTGLTPINWLAVYNQNTALTPPSGPTSGVGSFSNIPVTLSPGSYVDVTYTLAVANNQTLGSFGVYSYARPAAADYNSSGNANRDDFVINVFEKRVDLTVTKAALSPMSPGKRGRFLITVTAPLTNDVTINPGSVLQDDLPAGFVVRSWIATYSGGSAGPASGGTLPVTLTALPPGSSVAYEVEVFVKSTTKAGAAENCAKVTLPKGYVIELTGRNCVSGCVDFVIDPPVASPCHKFSGQMVSLPCDFSGSYTGTVKIELVSPNGKVWSPTATRCGGNTGLGAPIIAGWMETVEVSGDGCWLTSHSYPRNGDLVVPCEYEDCHPATYYKITESVSTQGGAASTNTYHVRLWSDAEYPPVLNVSEFDELNPFCLPGEDHC
jgi:hypothetical protein